MHGHDIIVIGASAGGVKALQELVRQLPDNLPATLFVVLHVANQNGSTMLSSILDRAGKLENAIYSALRALEEKAETLRRMAQRFKERFPDLQTRYKHEAGELAESAAILRQLLASRPV